jgi:hypothetical protein
MVGIQRPGAVRPHQVVVDQRSEVVIRQTGDARQLVGGAEPVEEVEEGDTGLERGHLGDERQIVCLLHRTRGEQGKAGGPHRHHVLVIAEDAQRMRRDGTRGHMNHRARQLAGDLVHVGDHQQQPLGGRERRPQRADLQGTVQRTRGAAFALHFHDLGDRAPDVRDPLARPLVRQLRHGGGRRDRVDRADLVRAIRDAGARLVPVHGHRRRRLDLGARLPARALTQRRRHGVAAGSGVISIAWHGHCSKQMAQPVQRS